MRPAESKRPGLETAGTAAWGAPRSTACLQGFVIRERGPLGEVLSEGSRPLTLQLRDRNAKDKIGTRTAFPGTPLQGPPYRLPRERLPWSRHRPPRLSLPLACVRSPCPHGEGESPGNTAGSTCVFQKTFLRTDFPGKADLKMGIFCLKRE